MHAVTMTEGGLGLNQIGVFLPHELYQLWLRMIQDDPTITPDDVHRAWTDYSGRSLGEILATFTA